MKFQDRLVLQARGADSLTLIRLVRPRRRFGSRRVFDLTRYFVQRLILFANVFGKKAARPVAR
jgi:hypothetical protein